MKSVCYVVLPDNLILDDDTVYAFVKNYIAKYYSELEVEPYKKFFSEKQTWEIARKNGFNNLIDFEEHLKTHKDEDGIENGLYYWITTYNKQGRWDCIRLDGIKKCSELINEPLPYSVVTSDGIWHSEMDYGYKPVRDFNIGKIHPDNIEPQKQWINFLNGFFENYGDEYVAILYVHS